MFAKPLTALALVAAMAAPALAGDALTAFDVAENKTRFSFVPAPVFDDGMPAHGNPFISQGYIYPAGTLAGGATGVLENDADGVIEQRLLGFTEPMGAILTFTLLADDGDA